MKYSKATFLSLLLAGTLSAGAVTPTEEIRQKASNYYAYPYTTSPAPALTAAPDGYEPFHMEHYGRHGSRWHIGKKAYNRPVELLLPAERNNKLTPRGKQLMKELRQWQSQSIGRDGELTQVGADQHRGIARRMYKNFPEIFAGNGRVDARSSVVIRCILSMDNELQELKAANPNLRITSDASHGDMIYIAEDETKGMDPKYFNAYLNYADRQAKNYSKRHPESKDFLKNIVTDMKFAEDSLDISSLRHYLFNIAANSQSHYGMPAPWDIFTEQEVVDRWKARNVEWYLDDGNTRLNGNLQPYTQQNLMRNIILSADTAIVNGGNGANMRFGHEVIVLPFTVLSEMGHYGKEINDMDSVADQWRNYEVFPMGSNIQFIFYRPKGQKPTADNTLVKVLLNEREMTLPVKAVDSPYYKWSDLRKYYLDKLGKMPTGRPSDAVYKAGSKVDSRLGVDYKNRPVKLGNGKTALVFLPESVSSKNEKDFSKWLDTAESLGRLGFSVIAVAVEPRAAVEEFIGKYGVKYPVVVDPGHYLVEKFGRWDIQGGSHKDKKAAKHADADKDAIMGVTPGVLFLDKSRLVGTSNPL